jgi:glycosyltransferase involved in cell wall biosynthesis
LQQIGEVTIAVVSSDSAKRGVVEQTAIEFDIHPPIRVLVPPNRSVTERMRRTLDPRHMNVHGCVAYFADRAQLLAQLPGVNLVWVLNSRTPNILQHWRWPKSVLDLDDIPSIFQRSRQQTASKISERWRAGIESHVSRRRERFWQQRFGALAVCSEADRQYLGGGPHIHVIPNGFARPLQEPVRRPVDPPRIGFIGLHSYAPNLEGVRWFVRECWPLIKRSVPNARLRLVGKDTDGPLKPAAPDVDALGWVADPADEIATWSAMIIPIRSGAGTRIKIADAFSRKCPVVSTTLGAYGYEVRNGEELVLADRSEDFSGACVSLVRDPQRGSAMADRAWQKFLERWTWESIAPRVRAAAEYALRRSSQNGQISNE